MEYGTGLRFAAFYLSEPERTAPVPLPNQDLPAYPIQNMWNQFEGYVLMQFVVDSVGRTEANSVRDLWPAGKLRLSGDSLSAYNEFVHVVRVWQSRMRYTPARIGPCAVRQQERQPVMFKFQSR